MKLKLLAAVLAASALPVLAQTGAATAPAEPSHARVEVDNGTTAAPKSAKATKSAKKSSKKSSKKKSKKPAQNAG